MKFFAALFSHFGLILRLKHDGQGMPENMPAAVALVGIYGLLGLINYSYQGSINLNALIGLCLVAQCYLFYLRDKLIGLIISISILMNAIAMILNMLVGITEQSIFVLNMIEYILIFAAIINVIRRESRTI